MRRLLSAATVLGLLSAGPSNAAPQCTSATDQAAFEEMALQTQIKLLALHACTEDAKVNAFTRANLSDLANAEKTVTRYFQHRFGARGQTELDRFKTDLANAVSDQANALGGDYCARNVLILQEVLSLRSPAELAAFAAGKNPMPASLPVCTPMPVPAHKAAGKAKYPHIKKAGTAGDRPFSLAERPGA